MVTYFKDGCVVITGAASGIGRETARVFARDGCIRLFLGDLSIDGLSETKNWILSEHPTANIEVAVVNIADEEAVEKFVQGAVTAFGHIDFAVNAAGFAHKAASVVDLSDGDWEKSYKVNLRGTFLCERALLRQMIRQKPLPGYECRASIVNITSLCATISIPGLTAYSASKGGVLGMSKTDALDYGPDKIRINCIAPGTIETPMSLNSLGADYLKANAKLTPLNRNGQPEDVANAVAWLSSPHAGFITGITLPVDGGLNLYTGPPV
ncbi:putative oxidoreductase [Lachnellula hyalina]|uniref:Putative oxidoreductase n=1 Tax=Lachnellula hyalina TaxID=1316788 RepID=A0A8H8TYF4_9HELO|nr:putative oxidoreductase [Lachnellula hyalina]TVY24862.1 putative oxidoreductase [Lachnellula hyalina]